jgi:SRSO17 transposase
VFLGYAGRHGRALIDRALYLPESWAKAPERRAGAGVPEDVRFTPKPKLGRAMLARALGAEVPFAWVTADSVYGGAYALRRWLQDRGLGYVLAVTGAQRLGFERVEDWAEAVPPDGWHRLSAGDGAKGPRLYDWAYATYPSDAAPGWGKGLLIRRPIAEPAGLTFYLTHAPEAATLADLVRVAGTRWTIEACFEAAKGEAGLDEYEVRSWTGWHRHVTLAMLAHAYLAVVCEAAARGRGGARLGRGPAAAHRAGDPPPALAPGLGERARTRRRPGLVALATASPAARQTMSLATTNPP